MMSDTSNDQSQDGVSIEEKSCVDENGKSVSECLQTRDYWKEPLALQRGRGIFERLNLRKRGKPKFEIDEANSCRGWNSRQL